MQELNILSDRPHGVLRLQQRSLGSGIEILCNSNHVLTVYACDSSGRCTTLYRGPHGPQPYHQSTLFSFP